MALQAAFAVRRVISSLVGISALLAAGIGSSGAATAAEPWPANLHAVYDINFNGFNVGTFDFQSQAESQSYTLTGNARLSVLLGAFKWDGETRSFGTGGVFLVEDTVGAGHQTRTLGSDDCVFVTVAC